MECYHPEQKGRALCRGPSPLPLQRLADLAAGASVLIEVLGVRFLVEECFGYRTGLSMFWFSWIPCFSA